MIKKSESESKLKNIVEMCGGKWLGIEETPSRLRVPRENLVLFNHPLSHSTMALPISKVTVENVRRKLKACMIVKARGSIDSCQ